MDEQHHFGEREPFSLGLEQELFVVDRADGRLLNAAPAVVEQLGELERGSVKNELHQSQVELITGVCSTVAEAVAELGELRRAVLATGVGVIASGTHPTAGEGESAITELPRYQRVHHLLGDAGITPVSALHVHIGMPDPGTAIRVFNGLRRYLALLEALGANSPFRHGRDTLLASSRELTLRSWPRSGVPRVMADLEDFIRSTEVLSRVAEVPDYTFHWWKLRPHPRLGTVEIRALDTQVSPQHTAALAALVHALARHEAEAEPVEGPPTEILDEAAFRAGRAGVGATLPDDEGCLRPVAELLEQTLARVSPAARELRCERELDGLA
ncbi:MAG: YbdK family carboxylate-amine ligase, partial [Actinomycetota bacterium]|nr:YbdK family carboxylate-amine ligase [Actinomycetota bacterium]